MSDTVIDRAIGLPSWEIEQRVIAIAADQCSRRRASLSLETRLLEDLDLDSLSLVEFIQAVEFAFDIVIPNEAAQELFTAFSTTLGRVAGLVEKLQQKGSRSSQPSNLAFSQQSAELLPFTQLDGQMSLSEWTLQPLHERIGPNREGYLQLRRRTDGMRCIAIPAARVWIGSSSVEALPDQRPAHQVEITGFLMDAELVSTAAYSRFLNSVADVPPAVLREWSGVEPADHRSAHYPLKRVRGAWMPVEGAAENPMVLVSWFGANAYSLWANQLDWRYYRANGTTAGVLYGRAGDAPGPPGSSMFSRLPSETQFEYAARGPAAVDAEITPGQASVVDATVARHTAGSSYPDRPLPSAGVSARMGMSPFGLHHVIGNVWEWCRDWYAPDFYLRPEACACDPQNTSATGIRSERGGSWVGPARIAHPAYRRGRPPWARGRCQGFRCAAPIPGPVPE